MKRALFMLLAAVVVAGLAGCAHHGKHCSSRGHGILGSCAHAPETCQTCEPEPCQTCKPRRPHVCRSKHCETCAPGPPIGAITYPYYTVRGPRDFLVRSPRPIGP